MYMLVAREDIQSQNCNALSPNNFERNGLTGHYFEMAFTNRFSEEKMPAA